MHIADWINTIISFLPLLVFASLLWGMMHYAKRERPDKYDQLKKLADLKNAGVLNEREFEIEKQKILRRD
jgi:hypothetical protein